MEQLNLNVVTKQVEAEAIGSNHCGFIKGKSLLTNLVVIYNVMTSKADEGRAVDDVCLGFSKAFHIVCDNILTGKPRNCGLYERTVRWIENWLTGRAQIVVISGAV